MISIRDSATLGLVYSGAARLPSLTVAQSGGRGGCIGGQEAEAVSSPHTLLLHTVSQSEDGRVSVTLSTALLGRLAVHITLQTRANDASGCRLIVAPPPLRRTSLEKTE